MRYTLLIWILLVSISMTYGQEADVEDSKYLEDQVYISLSYDVLLNKPKSISQNGFSGGFSIGFIKDIPLNKKRTVGIAVGFGYAYDAYIQNLKITKNGNTNFETAIDYSSNALRLHFIEVPFELRWRNSTPTRYKFWRAYTGLKLGYLLTGKSKFNDVNGVQKIKDIPELEDFHLGLYLAVGYSTWNIYTYLGLNQMFNNASLDNNTIVMKPFKVGLKFYIL